MFIKKNGHNFVIIAIYVDNLNLIGTPEEVQKATECLKQKFEIKDLGKIKLCLGLQMEQLEDGIFLHQSNYTAKVLKRFYIDKPHPLSTPMVVRSLEVNKDPFRPKERDEKTIGT